MIRSRIAPTPSGFLHPGNIYSFVLTWLLVKKQGGKLLLRIDDLDSGRVRDQYVQNIFQTLETLELTYDEGPANAAAFRENWSQQLRRPAYDALLGKLVAAAEVYACTCSKKQLTDMSPERHPCRQKEVSLDEPGISWRLYIPKKTAMVIPDDLQGELICDLGEMMPDPVVRKKDGSPSYQVASLADDQAFDINYVVRGLDLLPSTACQLFMAQLLGIKAFQSAKFLHHSLVVDASGNKLSKSAGNHIVSNKLFNRDAIIHDLLEFPILNKLPKSCGSLADMLEAFEPSMLAG